MKKKLFLVFLGLAACGVFLEAQTLDEAILRAALRIGTDLPTGATVAVIHFRSDSERLNDYVINELHNAILRNRRVTPVKPDETRFQSIRDELRFNEAGEIDEESAQSIGRLLGVRYLVTGSIERGNSGYGILFTAVDAESAELQSRYSASVNPNDAALVSMLGRSPGGGASGGGASESGALPLSPEDAARARAWRKKRVYLGGMLGGGFHEYEYKVRYSGRYSDYYRTYTGGIGGLFALGFVSEFALLPFFSIELDLGFGAPGQTDHGLLKVIPVIPILAKLGGRFGQVELSFDIGYTIGLGFTLGGTFGVHAGPGVLFVKMLGMPEPSVPSAAVQNDASFDSAMLWFVGYKVGLGDKKPRALPVKSAIKEEDIQANGEAKEEAAQANEEVKPVRRPVRR